MSCNIVEEKWTVLLLWYVLHEVLKDHPHIIRERDTSHHSRLASGHSQPTWQGSTEAKLDNTYVQGTKTSYYVSWHEYDTDAATIALILALLWVPHFLRYQFLTVFCLSGYSMLNAQYNDKYMYILDKNSVQLDYWLHWAITTLKFWLASSMYLFMTNQLITEGYQYLPCR